jgi:hypothetical protein
MYMYIYIYMCVCVYTTLIHMTKSLYCSVQRKPHQARRGGVNLAARRSGTHAHIHVRARIRYHANSQQP